MHLSVAAADGQTASLGLMAAERAVRQALERAAATVGDEVVVLRRVETAWKAGIEGGHAGRGLERKLAALLEVHLGRESRSSPSRARFASMAAAEAAYIGALVEGRSGAFPFSALTHLGASPGSVLRGASGRGRLSLADLLAELVRNLSPEALLRAIGPAEAADVLARLGAADARLSPGPPPESVVALSASLARSLSHQASAEQVLVAAAARLFSLWPPARGSALDLTWLSARIGEPAPARSERGEGRARAQQPLASGAGGLAVWAALAMDCGLDGRLVDAYSSIRERRAVRWALGRVLADPTLSPSDPLLALWSGELPSEPSIGAGGLTDVDPEPLHTAAMVWARESGLLDRPLTLSQLGDGVVVTTPDKLLVDALEGVETDEAISNVAARFTARVGHPPSVLHVRPLSMATIDAVAELDSPSLPPVSRPGLLAFASCLRAALRARWGAPVKATRSLTALIEGIEPVRLSMRAGELLTITKGAAFPTSIILGEQPCEIALGLAQ